MKCLLIVILCDLTSVFYDLFYMKYEIILFFATKKRNKGVNRFVEAGGVRGLSV